MVKTYVDPVKAKSRELIRNFIKYHHRNRAPSDLCVLCFPGAEQDEEVALEVKEIYDPLGIPRKNIVGLEKGISRARRLKNANMGIEVVTEDAIIYLQQTDRKFDVISLDYTSNFGDPQRYAIDLIAGRRVLGKRGVLVTNYLAQRETEEAKNDMLIGTALCKRIVSKPLKKLSQIFEYAQEAVNDIEKGEVELQIGRSAGITHAIAASLVWGEAAINPRVFMRIYDAGNFEQCLDEMKKNLRENLDRTGRLCFGKTEDEMVARTRNFRLNMRAAFNASVGEVLNTKGLEYLAPFIWMGIVNPYFIEDHKAFTYTSNSGSPMFLDLWFIADHVERIRRSRFLELRATKTNTEIHILPGITDQRLIDKHMSKAARAVMDLLPKSDEHQLFHPNQPREHLGSSYEPANRKKRINKEKALELLKAGTSPVEITSIYAGFSKMQLAAMKAHLTMGTYDKEKNT